MTSTRPRLRALVACAVAAVAVLAVGAAPASAAPAEPRPAFTFSTLPEAPSRYQGQVSCDPREKPGVTALRAVLKATYGYANSGGSVRSCSQGGQSEHKEGRAYDWMRDVAVPEQKAMADAFVAWATGPDPRGVAGGNAHRMGVQYLIWNKRIWNARSGWKAYTGSSPHTDHVHVSLSWDGAWKRTSWWDGTVVTRFDQGPCQFFVGEPARPYSAPNYSPCPDPIPRVAGTFAADFDGDGRDEVGTYHSGRFVVRTASGLVSVPFGQPGDLPVAGDWDGDGRAGIGVFRGGTWYLRQTLTSGQPQVSFTSGRAGDRPVVGDWDGNGTDEVAVFRSGTWFVRVSTRPTAVTRTVVWGQAGDRAVAGDWDRDGADDLGLVRSSTWYLAADASASRLFRQVRFGWTNGLPVAGDWDGDGRDTFGSLKMAELARTSSPYGWGPVVERAPL
ncbi:VCBS repeat-containing protein [Aquipuribacter nitratireducens]|uniref:VCBS repeat-containing protein n=1 Tax=Aquipuribacter nitratireducens TaxID=650104 RepID=A0ABW0GNJ1_9MICO